MEEKKKQVPVQDWVEKYLQKLRSQIYLHISKYSAQDDSVNKMQSQFQHILELLSVVVQDVISELFPKIEKMKSEYMTEVQDLENRLQKLENKYKEAKGDLLKGAKILEDIHSFEERMQSKIKQIPGIPQISVNQKKLKEAVQGAINVKLLQKLQADDFFQGLQFSDDELDPIEEVKHKTTSKVMIQAVRGKDTIYIFDLKQQKSWSVKSFFKFPQEFAATQIDQVLFITGGCYKGAKSVNDTIKISNLGQHVNQLLAPMHRSRNRHSLCGNKALLLASGDVGCAKQTQFYTIAQDIWQKSAPLVHGRREHASLFIEDNAFVIGGYSSQGSESSCERMKIKEKAKWEKLSLKLPFLYHFQATLATDKVFVFGTDGTHSYVTEIYRDFGSYEQFEAKNKVISTSSDLICTFYQNKLYSFVNHYPVQLTVWDGVRWTFKSV